MDEREGTDDRAGSAAEPRLCASTPRSGIRPLVAGVHAVHTLHRQIATVLEERGGAQLAALLAEPHEGPTEIDWYSCLSGPAVRWTEVSSRERSAAQAALRARVADVARLAGELRGAGQDQVATLLEEALTVPGEQHIFLLGGEPVLTCWGFLSDVEPPVGLDLLAAHKRQAATGPLGTPAPAAPDDAPGEWRTVLMPAIRPAPKPDVDLAAARPELAAAAKREDVNLVARAAEASAVAKPAPVMVEQRAVPPAATRPVPPRIVEAPRATASAPPRMVPPSTPPPASAPPPGTAPRPAPPPMRPVAPRPLQPPVAPVARPFAPPPVRPAAPRMAPPAQDPQTVLSPVYAVTERNLPAAPPEPETRSGGGCLWPLLIGVPLVLLIAVLVFGFLVFLYS